MSKVLAARVITDLRGAYFKDVLPIIINGRCEISLFTVCIPRLLFEN